MFSRFFTYFQTPKTYPVEGSVLSPSASSASSEVAATCAMDCLCFRRSSSVIDVAPCSPGIELSLRAPSADGVIAIEPQPSPSINPLSLPPWDTLTWVEKLPGGYSDGAYRLSFRDHPPIVLKVSTTAAAQVFAMGLAPTVGIKAPRVCWMSSRSDDGKALKAELEALFDSSGVNEDVRQLLKMMGKGGRSLVFMEHLYGLPLGKTARNFVKKNDPIAVLRSIGRLAAFDLIMGNQDRFENFDPNDCLGGGRSLPANFGNVFLLSATECPDPVAAIDTTLVNDSYSGTERSIYSKVRVGTPQIQTTPSEIIAGMLANPEKVNGYVSNNIVQMLEETVSLPAKSGHTIQQGFIDALHEMAEHITSDQIDSLRLNLGLEDVDLPITTLERRLDGLRALLAQAPEAQ